MQSKEFKKLVESNSQKLNLEKYKTAFYAESEDSIVFLILRRSGYSSKYYLRLKTEIKPFKNDLDKEEFVKHDIADILLSLDSESPEIFDLENSLTDSERSEKMENFFTTTVKEWINNMLSKKSISDKHNYENLFLLPYTKSKLGFK
ncbi:MULTISPECIES: hypothetical protein [unclassified Salegentibacter]|uniref:hypothetical protein n=1 Tax=unclassified Salegentibacter TaxID=2633436 RepID=UPI00094A952D|nr:MULTISPECIES: hypothetical protein [unclassified Salegentibacter]APS40158.1 hypothetical protein AO058_15295 [Salegentibacter sp. T436]